jgi:hypothetical protein
MGVMHAAQPAPRTRLDQRKPCRPFRECPAYRAIGNSGMLARRWNV